MKNFLEEISIGNTTSLRYEDLSEWKVGEAMIKEAVKRWEQIGFLESLEDENKKEILAVAFDNMAHDLLVENEKVIKIKKRYDFNCNEGNNAKVSLPFDVIVFPLLRSVVCKVDNFNYNEFLTYLEKYSFLAINYDGYDFIGECDIEAEFCALLSLIIEYQFNNKKNKK